MADVLNKRPRYPGRVRVLTRDAARDYVFNRSVVEHGTDKFACLSPIELPAIGLPSGVLPDARSALAVTMEARCRHCDNCLAHRRRLWTARAVDEIAAAARTWFGTLTVSPEQRFRVKLSAEKRKLRAGGETVSDLDSDELFRVLVAEMSLEVTRWLKRVRSVADGPLRYLLVFEAHKDGFPHAHILVHEVASKAVTKAKLETQWRIGFSHWRLVEDDPRAALYVCKYLNKSARTRVRASGRYGQAALVRFSTEALGSIADTVLSQRTKQCDGSTGDGTGER